MVQGCASGGDLIAEQVVTDLCNIFHGRVQLRKFRAVHIEVPMVKAIKHRAADNSLKRSGCEGRRTRTSTYAHSHRDSVVVTVPARVIAFTEGASILVVGQFRAMQSVRGAKFKLLGHDGVIAHGGTPEKVDERAGCPSNGGKRNSMWEISLQNNTHLSDSVSGMNGVCGSKE
jgi:hypothetical protein